MRVTDYDIDLAAKRTRLNLEAVLDALPFDDPSYADINAQIAANRRYHRRPKPEPKVCEACGQRLPREKGAKTTEGHTQC